MDTEKEGWWVNTKGYAEYKVNTCDNSKNRNDRTAGDSDDEVEVPLKIGMQDLGPDFKAEFDFQRTQFESSPRGNN